MTSKTHPFKQIGMVLMFGVLLALTACNTSTTTPPAGNSVSDTTQAASVSMTLDAKGYIPFDTVVGIPWKSAMTVSDAVHATKAFQFGIKEYPDLGHLVEAVNGLKNNTHDGHYWQFCVDGVFSEVGMDKKSLEAGQTVSWYYRAYGEGPCKKIGE
jgi:hypothetical protein